MRVWMRVWVRNELKSLIRSLLKRKRTKKKPTIARVLNLVSNPKGPAYKNLQAIGIRQGDIKLLLREAFEHYNIYAERNGKPWLRYDQVLTLIMKKP